MTFKRLTLLAALVSAGLLATGCRSTEDSNTGQTAQTAAQETGEGRVAPSEQSAFGAPSDTANAELKDQSGKPGSNTTLREESEMGGNAAHSQHSETRRTDPRGDSLPGTGGAGAGGSGAADAGTDGGK